MMFWVLVGLLCQTERAEATKVTLAWNPSPDAHVAGYRIWYGVSSRTYTNAVPVGLTTNATVTGLTPGVTYYIAATAYSDIGIEDSEFSNEVSYQPPIESGTINLSGLTQTYDGLSKTVTATTVPAGLSVSVTYNGSVSAPVNVGSYQVVARVMDPGYSAVVTNTLVVGKATAQVVLGGLSQVYSGTARVVTATTQPAGLAVGLSYNGSGTAPVNAGSYPVSAQVSDANYSGSAVGTLVVAKAPATVLLGNLNQGYDGTAKAVSVSTQPAGLSTQVTYNGQSSVPSAVGSYSVVATVNDVNYSGSASGTLQIGAGGVTILLGNLSQVYDGSARVVSLSTQPAGVACSLTYNGQSVAPTNAGTYEVVAMANDGTHTGSVTNTLVVAKATASVQWSNLSQVYDGSARVAEATTQPSALPMSLTYDDQSAAPVNAGSYVVVATVNDANYTGSVTNTLTVAKATAQVSLAALTQLYDGTPRSITASTQPGGLAVSLSYNGSGSAPVNSGSYSVSAQISDVNYSGSAVGTLVVAKAPATVLLGNLSQAYDGTAKAVSVSTQPAGLSTSVTYNGQSSVPSAVGSYSVVATVNDVNYSGSVSGTLQIGPSGVTILLGDLSQVYDGAARAVSVSTQPAGVACSLTYNGQSVAPTNAGTYEVVAMANDGTHTGAVTNTLVVAKATASVQWSNLSQVYDGSARAVGASTQPSGLAVSLSYDGQSAAPVNAGSYVVVATVNDANYSGTATSTLVVAKATAQVVFGSLSQVYSGTARIVTASTLPSGLAVGMSYNGSASAPINAGSYPVSAQVSDANYTGSVSGTLVVAKAPATVLLGNLSQAYDGTAKAVSVSTQPAGLSTQVTYNGQSSAPSAVGSYSVVATVNDVNYSGSASGTLQIGPGGVTIVLGNLSQVYNGTARTVSLSTQPTGVACSLTYNGQSVAPTNAGSYVVVAMANDGTHTGAVTNTLVVAKAAASVQWSNLSQVYDGSAKVVGASTQPSGLPVSLSYNGQSAAPVNAGSYTVVATINHANYVGSGTNTFTVAKATAQVVLGGLSQVYSGTARVVTASTQPSGLAVSLSYNGSGNAPVNAGSYPVSAQVNDLNYGGSASGTLVVGKAVATVLLSNLNQAYDGTAKAVSVSTQPAGLSTQVTYNGQSSAPSAVGSYSVVATVNHANYSGSASGALQIGPSGVTILLGNLSQVYNGAARVVSLTTQPAGVACSLTYNGQSCAPTNAGSYVVVAMATDGTHTGAVTNTLVVVKATATVQWSNLSQVYDGSAKAVGASTQPSGLPVSLSYDGQSVAPVNAGSYTVVATVDDANYAGSVTNTLTVAKAPAQVLLGNLWQVYNGAARVTTATTQPRGLAVELTYKGLVTPPTNAGIYQVVGVVNELNYRGSATNTLVVAKATASLVLGNLTQNHDGTPKQVSVTTQPAGLVARVTYNGLTGAPSAIGKYNVVATIEDSNYSGSATGMLQIEAPAITVSLGNLSQVYDGTARVVSFVAQPASTPCSLTYNGQSSAPTNAGTYTVVATVQDGARNVSVTNTLIVAPAQAQVFLANLNTTFDGRSKPARVTTKPGGLGVEVTYDGGQVVPVAAGTYLVTATVKDINHVGATTGTLTIGKAQASISFADLVQLEDGSPKPVTPIIEPAGLQVALTYDGNAEAPSEPGTYQVVAEIIDVNYAGSATATLTVLQAENKVVLEWPATSNTVTLFESTDLAHWSTLTNLTSQTTSLALFGQEGPHFYRAVSSGPAGSSALPLSIRRPAAMGASLAPSIRSNVRGTGAGVPAQGN
jgi:hypothetical protein